MNDAIKQDLIKGFTEQVKSAPLLIDDKNVSKLIKDITNPRVTKKENEDAVNQLVDVVEGDRESYLNARMPFVDRDMSWLDFNSRVLGQINRVYKDMPVVKGQEFIGIAASNLDEFISVRFAQAYRDAENDDTADVKRRYGNLLGKIKGNKSSIVLSFKSLFESINVFNGKIAEPDYDNNGKLAKYFECQIFPVITPIAVGNNKEVPRFDDEDVNFFIKLKDDTTEDEKFVYCFIQVPHQIQRIIFRNDVYYFVEDLIRAKLDEIFNQREVVECILFKVTKEQSDEVDHDEQVSIIERVNNVIKKREENNIVFLDVVTYNQESNDLVKKLVKLLKVPKNHVMIYNSDDGFRLALQCLKKSPFKKQSFIKMDADEKDVDVLEERAWKANFKPGIPAELVGETSLLSYLDEEDLIIHHPYETYDIVVRFLQEAAFDPKVISIKQTLYRVSSVKSPIIKALCDAAKSGKKVTVMLELLARGDEKRNISLINLLKEAGCNVVYSLEGLKTHCKICLVTKATKKGIVLYSHMGTGNYNEETAKIYTDYSYFTSKQVIGHDLNCIFNMITGFSIPVGLKMVQSAPHNLRARLVEEMGKVAKCGSGEICIQVNSISDREIVNKIYEIADANPDILFRIICRGACSLVARKNIQIKSIIGRFLEHARIYRFRYKYGPDNSKEHETLYISSADLLTRNLDKRIETLIPIGKKQRRKIVKDFDEMWIDNANSYMMEYDGTWTSIRDSSNYVNAQNNFIL